MLDRSKTSYEYKSDSAPKLPFLLITAGLAIAFLALLTRKVRSGRGGLQLAAPGFKTHPHSAMEHEHEHVHVTHNRTDLEKGVGGWEHLTAVHSHGHNHAALDHSHRPHRNARREHAAEAHVHDHEHPLRS
jgi:hypothetical protein